MGSIQEKIMRSTLRIHEIDKTISIDLQDGICMMGTTMKELGIYMERSWDLNEGSKWSWQRKHEIYIKKAWVLHKDRIRST